MCGRFVRRRDSLEYAGVLGVDSVPALSGSYSVAPSQPILAGLNHDGKREARLLVWGLIPSWSHEPTAFINARAETVAQKPSFRGSFRHHRCIIPADGYYEWKNENGRKQPYYFRLGGDQPFAFAGLWDTWRDIDGCAIITTEANDLSRPIHDRMPVMLSRESSELWLDPSSSPATLLSLLKPYPSAEMLCHPVSRLVNKAEHDSPACIQPA